MRVLIIGAGIVGLTLSFHCARRGMDVTIIDADAPGAGASSGNAGAISAGSVAPLAMPGVLRQVPAMLLDPKGALHVPLNYALRAAPWLARFVASARPARVAAIAEALATLQFAAMERHREILAAIGAPDLLRETGQLYLYRDDAHLAKDQAAWQLRAAHGLRIEHLHGAAAIAALEPGIAPSYTRGLFLPDQGSIINPRRYAETLAAHLAATGTRLLRARVTAIATEGPPALGAQRPRALGAMTAEGLIEAEITILAAGAYSARLLAPLGIRVPLETQRGYHIMLREPGVAPQRPLIPADRKAFITPMEQGLRIAGTVEFGGLDRAPTAARAGYLLEDLAKVYPAADTRAPEPFWMGHRPCLPDSLPVLGPTPTHPNLWCAFGHGHLGLTGAAPTAAILAAALAGAPANADLTPFSLARFG